MKNIFLSLVGMLLLSAAALAQDAQDKPDTSLEESLGRNNGRNSKLAGTWDATVTVRNCATGNAIVSFLSTANFNKGGTFSGITSGSSPTARTSERGIWEHLHGNFYRFRFKAYLYDPAGVAVAYQVVTQDVSLARNNRNYTSEGISEVFDMNGAPLSSGCSTSVGTRMVLD